MRPARWEPSIGTVTTEARRAIPADAPELVRLRRAMLTAMAGREPEPGPWQQTAEIALRERLAPERAGNTGPGSLAAFVVDRSDRPGALAACAIGTVEARLATPDNPAGVYGYVFNVATDPGCRRRGYSRACLRALLDWYRQQCVPVIDLHATAAGESLYRSFGFDQSRYPSMRLTAFRRSSF